MGNRAVITDTKERVGIYLHWNGGRDSVEAFLTYCDIRGYRSMSCDPSYAFARLTQTIANFFGADGLSIGVYPVSMLDTDNGDNGVYIVDGWEIVGRKYMRYGEQQGYDLLDMLIDIDQAQPAGTQLGAEEVTKRFEELMEKKATKETKE